MKIYEIRIMDEVKARLTYRKDGKIDRTLTIKVGEEYIIEPDNPQKKKHRGRLCQVTGFYQDEENKDLPRAIVKFLDTNRTGRVELEDLKIKS